MEAICTTPRSLRRSRPPVAGEAQLRAALPMAVALFAFGLSGCSIVFPPGGDCPSLEEVCPNLECPDGFAVNDDGCAQCECAEPQPEPAVCWDDADCASDQRCDAETFCEAPPGCADGEACPAVCYGRCVDEPAACFADEDCADDERCVFGGEPSPTEPAPPPPDDGSGDRACEPNPDGTCGETPPEDEPGVVAPSGVCLPAGCEEVPLAQPVCPDGSEPRFDFSEDPCGTPVCVSVDECRELDPETCSQTPGCRVEEVPQACGCPAGADCEPCAPESVCVSDDVVCEELSDEECLNHADCELVSSGGSSEAPCFSECDPEGNCTSDCDGGGAAPPPDDTTCVRRTPPPPREGECVVDEDCQAGQFCEIQDECGSMCDPSSNEPCPDVCVIIGFCQDEPTTTSCEFDADCGTGYLCEQTEVCECSGGGTSDPPDGGGGMEAPCVEECRTEGQCVWNPDNQTCFSDGDCAATQHCELFDSCMAPPDCPNCLVACQGVCVDDEPEPTACMSSDECVAGESCDTVNYCDAPPGCEEGMDCSAVCYGRCVQPEPVTADKCLEEADCAEGYRCASEVDACYCPEGETCDVCYWQCVPDDTSAP